MRTQFRSKSMTYGNRSMSPIQQVNAENQSTGNRTHRDASFTEIQNKLPVIQIKKFMTKIGAVNRNDFLFSPTNEEKNSFRKAKWQQLKNQYYRSRNKRKQPLNHELDEIVLGCWKYGEEFGQKTIWKKYKEKFDELSFDTLKVVKRKRW